jgi:hypothetical protein
MLKIKSNYRNHCHTKLRPSVTKAREIGIWQNKGDKDKLDIETQKIEPQLKIFHI